MEQFPPRPRVSADARLNEVRGAESECWPWRWRLSVRGYGTLVIKKVEYKAHVLAYERWVGPIPEGMVIDHTCHNADESCVGGPTCLHRRCVNPAHLEAVTDAINTLRGKGPAAVNAAKTHCSKGHEFTPENTYTPPSGGRYCRICTQEKCREWKRRKRARLRAEREAAAAA